MTSPLALVAVACTVTCTVACPVRQVLKDHISTCFEERWFPPLHEQVAHFLQ